MRKKIHVFAASFTISLSERLCHLKVIENHEELLRLQTSHKNSFSKAFRLFTSSTLTIRPV